MELDPKLAEAWLNRGLLHSRSGEHAAALADLARAAGAGLDEPTALYNLALIYLAAGDREAARDRLRQLLRLRPDHPGGAGLLNKLTRGPSGPRPGDTGD